MTSKEATKIVQNFDERKKYSAEEEFVFIEALQYLITEDHDPYAMMHLGGYYYEQRRFDLALKYYEMAAEYKFPEADIWGAVMPTDHPLAMKKSIKVKDLIGQPLFCSEQSWNNEIKAWARDRFSDLTLEGSFRLSYNGSVFARENLGILLTFKDLINTEGTDMVFRPLSPKLYSDLYLIWNRYQTFTPIAEKFLDQIRNAFSKDE